MILNKIFNMLKNNNDISMNLYFLSSLDNYDKIHLLSQKRFVDYLLNNPLILKDFITKLNIDTKIKALNNAIEQKQNNLIKAIIKTSATKDQLELVKEIYLNENIIKKIFSLLNEESLEFILKKHPNKYLIENISDEDLKKLYELELNLHDKLTPKLQNRLIKMLDINEYREIEINLQKNNNITTLIKKRQVFYDGVIKNFKRRNYTDPTLLANVIIDYHFRDSYHNVTLDLNEVLNYNTASMTSIISEDNRKLYELILNVHSLSHKDLLKLHKYLLTIDITKLMYFDIRNAKDSAYTNVKNSIINEENKNSYKNKKLTNKYGIDTYYLDGQEFTLLSKSLLTYTTDVLDEDALSINHDGASFSLIGHENIYTYKPIDEYYNIVFTDFNINHIVHMFPADSFSLFEHADNMQGNIATDRLNIISNTKEFLKQSKDYNELVIAQNNESDDTYNHIKSNPLTSFILCLNEPTKEMIISAKNLGLSLLIINYKKYKHLQNKNGITTRDIDYSNIYDKRLYTNRLLL